MTSRWEQLRIVVHELSLARSQPDVVGTTAITPSIYAPAGAMVLQIAKEELPDAVTVSAASTPPSCTSRCLSEAPWIDVIVRGEGEEITSN
jgi:anaerobic magnesium-protoporphyrin IX monomethyl ester cyclase